ncbi:MAG: YceI family protein [Holophagae bacterium]|jgi:polyisoprenoid-binding protein YceI
MKTRTILSGCLVVILATLASAAEPIELRLDADASRATFTLGSTLHTVHGEVPITRGTLRFDPEGGDASGEVVLDARGAVTGNKKRDKKMHNDVLRTGEFPDLVFRLTRVDGTLPTDGTAELQLAGSLVLLGEAHDIVIPAEVSRTGADIAGRGAVSIPYVAWGLEDPSVFVMRADKEIQVELEVRGELEP